MSVEGDIQTPEQPQRQATQGEQPTAQRERFWDLKASHCVEVFLTVVLIGIGLLQYRVYTRQAAIMDKQANIAFSQNEITVQSSRAIIYAKDVRVEKKDSAIPGKPGQFEAYWWFAPVIENGGSTSTKNMRISAQAAFDPSRPEIAVKLPLGVGAGAKQLIYLSHLPEAGPFDPETNLIEAEEAERQSKPSNIIRTILGPHVSEAIAGFGVPLEEAKQRMQEGGRWFILGAIHYDDRFSNASIRLSKYCFGIGFEITASGELNPTTPMPSLELRRRGM
jgi:hypothetical protein